MAELELDIGRLPTLSDQFMQSERRLYVYTVWAEKYIPDDRLKNMLLDENSVPAKEVHRQRHQEY